MIIIRMDSNEEKRQRDLLRYQLTRYLKRSGRTFSEAEMQRWVSFHRTRDLIAAHVTDCGFYGATRCELAKAFSLDPKTTDSMVASLIRLGRVIESTRHRISDTGKPSTVLVAIKSPSTEAGN